MAATVTVQDRLRWIDGTRGIAVLMVVLFHAVLVPVERDFSSPESLVWLNDFFSPIRMPLLLLLSGWFLPAALRKSPRAYTLGKLRMIVWPYLVWNSFRLLGESRHDLGILIDPRSWISAGYLWYLWYLAGYFLIALGVRRLPHWVTALTLLALSTLAVEYADFCYLGFFFFGGATVASSTRARRAVSARLMGVVGCGCFILVGLASTSGLSEDSRVMAPAVVIAAFGLVKFVQALPQRLMGPFETIGRSSLVVYVSHFPLIALSVTAVGAWAPLHVNWAWLASLAVGFLGSIAMIPLRKYRASRWLFEFPKWTPSHDRSSRTEGHT